MFPYVSVKKIRVFLGEKVQDISCIFVKRKSNSFGLYLFFNKFMFFFYYYFLI